MEEEVEAEGLGRVVVVVVEDMEEGEEIGMMGMEEADSGMPDDERELVVVDSEADGRVDSGASGEVALEVEVTGRGTGMSHGWVAENGIEELPIRFEQPCTRPVALSRFSQA